MSERLGARLLKMNREPPGLKRAPVVRSAEAAVLRGWCLGCAYDLRRIHGPEASCPECGRVFVPVDEESYAGTARVNDEHAARLFLRRHGLKVVVLLFVAALWINGLLPTPVRGQGGRLWQWARYSFGEERQILSNGAEARLWWWADALWSVEADAGPRAVVAPGEAPAPDPALAWEVRRKRGGTWELRVHQAGVPFRDVNLAFNTMKQPGMFGIFLDDVGRNHSAGPFEVSGTRTEVMSKIVAEFDCRPVPFLLRADQPYVWMFDPNDGRLYPLATEAAELAGVEIRRSRILGETRRFIHPTDEGVTTLSPEEVPEHWLPHTAAPGSEKPGR